MAKPNTKPTLISTSKPSSERSKAIPTPMAMPRPV